MDWFRTDPLKAMFVVCSACVAAVLALAPRLPWRFLQDAAADFVGGTLAGMLIFVLANVAFGFTEKRERERHALLIACDMLVPELLDNVSELERIVKVLREGSLAWYDPVYSDRARLKVENWQLLVQGPLVANLPADVLWTINSSYYVSRRCVEKLSETKEAIRNPDTWKDICAEHLPRFEAAVALVASAHDQLNAVRERLGPRTRRAPAHPIDNDRRLHL